MIHLNQLKSFNKMMGLKNEIECLKSIDCSFITEHLFLNNVTLQPLDSID